MRDLDDKLVGIGALTVIALAWIVASSFGKAVDKTVVLAISSGIAGLVTGRAMK